MISVVDETGDGAVVEVVEGNVVVVELDVVVVVVA